MTFVDLMRRVTSGGDLPESESRAAAIAVMNGEWEPAQSAALLVALHMKGETADEICGFASVMRDAAVPVPLSGKPLMDTCGTGGDGKRSFNISTVVAFVLAGCGIPVAKHGNRAASSACGSADMLEAMGIRCRLHPEEAAEALEQVGFAFLFAPDYHPATRSVAQIRRLLGVPTLFNLLGPLTNPARPAAQLTGVFQHRALTLVAEAQRRMNPQSRALFLHSEDGWDEATPAARFHALPAGGSLATQDPCDFGFPRCRPEELQGGTPAENAAIALSILNGERGPRRDAVLLNALLAYQTYYQGSSREQALSAVTESLDSGAARRVVRKLKEHYPYD